MRCFCFCFYAQRDSYKIRKGNTPAVFTRFLVLFDPSKN
ncbi:unnamed protein product [Mycetohabitans rhizoxinica HKI 454]|uniref:Uncharacterized protein n=1 Tax=Mycetohabitans rhizoxinica (strain DSM 19002 / CIP 109453 / HKI 454) TaxID=882378 RepID=E5ASF7_MYCRK|nr:unnamed protein product [Mycetohabitans rhizoxinica HKI 454]